MERLNSINEPDLSLSAFDRFPIWTWNDKQEGYNPVTGAGVLPGELPIFFIRATFTMRSGRQLVGYLMGLNSYFGFGLFVAGQDYLINFNLPDLAAPVFHSLALEFGEDVLPLRYRADVAFAGQTPIQGTFEKN